MLCFRPGADDGAQRGAAHHGSGLPSHPPPLLLYREGPQHGGQSGESALPPHTEGHDVLLQAGADERPGVLHQRGAGKRGRPALQGPVGAAAQSELVPREQQPPPASQLRAAAPLPRPHAAHRVRPGQ